MGSYKKKTGPQYRHEGLYRPPRLSIIAPKYGEIVMRFRIFLIGRSPICGRYRPRLRSFALAGAALALSAAVGLSATKPAPQPKGP